MPGEATEPHAVGGIGVVQSGILRFDAVKGPVKGVYFDADLRYEVSGNVCSKIPRVSAARAREQRVVHELGNRRFAHGRG